MNDLSIQNVLSSIFVFLKTQVTKSLTVQQKKVVLVAVMIFSLFATAIFIYRYFFQAKKIASDDLKNTRDLNRVDSIGDLTKEGNSNLVDLKEELDLARKDSENFQLEIVKVFLKSKNLELKDLKNRDVVKMTVQIYGWMLKFAPDYQDDEEIVGLAVSCHPYAIRFASDRLRGKSKIVVLAVSKEGVTAQYATEELRQEDRQLAKLAVKNNWRALKFFPAFQGDKEVVLPAIVNELQERFYLCENDK